MEANKIYTLTDFTNGKVSVRCNNYEELDRFVRKLYSINLLSRSDIFFEEWGYDEYYWRKREDFMGQTNFSYDIESGCFYLSKEEDRILIDFKEIEL